MAMFQSMPDLTVTIWPTLKSNLVMLGGLMA